MTTYDDDNNNAHNHAIAATSIVFMLLRHAICNRVSRALGVVGCVQGYRQVCRKYFDIFYSVNKKLLMEAE
jgi:hypothetical protein